MPIQITPFPYNEGDNNTGGGSGYTLPIASEETLGGVKIDGDTISIDENGVIKANTTTDYEKLENKPQINNIELTGNVTLQDLGMPSALPNPNALTIKYNGQVAFTYDGSKPETGNFIVTANTVPMSETDTTTIQQMIDGMVPFSTVNDIPNSIQLNNGCGLYSKTLSGTNANLASMKSNNISLGDSSYLLDLNIPNATRPRAVEQDGSIHNMAYMSDIENVKIPVATGQTLGGIKVDNQTTIVGTDGTLKVNTEQIVPYALYDNRKFIQLANHDALSGVLPDGSDGVNLIMCSKWGKVDVGSSKVPMNLNTDDVVTINDDKVVATTEDVQNAISEIDLTPYAVKEQADKDYAHAETLLPGIVTDVFGQMIYNPYNVQVAYNKAIKHGTTGDEVEYIEEPAERHNFVIDGATTENAGVMSAADKAKLDSMDLTQYATKDEIPTNVSALTNDVGYITEIPSEYITDTELESKGYLTEHQDISNLATKEEVQDVKELTPVMVQIPIRTNSTFNTVQDKETILGWFGCTQDSELKGLISRQQPMFLKYGISLSTNPHYYKMPIEYIAYETANQVKLVFTGLDTSDDSVVKYTILMNLDGTIIGDTNSNVQLVMEPITSGEVGTVGTLTFNVNNEEIFTYTGATNTANLQINGTTLPISNEDDTTIKESIDNTNQSLQDFVNEVDSTYLKIADKFSGSYNDLTDKPTIPEAYVLPTASDTVLGGVKVDNTTITIQDGVISANVGTPGTSDYTQLTNKPQIENIELTGNKTLADLGIQPAGDYITKEVNNLTNYTLTSQLSTVATSGSFEDLTDKPIIPSEYTLPIATQDILGGVKPDGTTTVVDEQGQLSVNIEVPTLTSELTNDSGFITKDVTDLTNYTKTEDLATVATTGNYSDLQNIPNNITMKGNDINMSNGLVVLDNEGKLPAVDGSQLTNISATVTLNDVDEFISGNIKGLEIEKVSDTAYKVKSGHCIDETGTEVITLASDLTLSINVFGDAEGNYKPDDDNYIPSKTAAIGSLIPFEGGPNQTGSGYFEDVTRKWFDGNTNTGSNIKRNSTYYNVTLPVPVPAGTYEFRTYGDNFILAVKSPSTNYTDVISYQGQGAEWRTYQFQAPYGISNVQIRNYMPEDTAETTLNTSIKEIQLWGTSEVITPIYIAKNTEGEVVVIAGSVPTDYTYKRRIGTICFNSEGTSIVYVTPNKTLQDAYVSGDISIPTYVQDDESQTVTIDTLPSGHHYTYGTITSLAITSLDGTKCKEESTIRFTAGSTISVTIPTDTKVIGDFLFEANKEYIICIWNGIAVSAEISNQS